MWKDAKEAGKLGWLKSKHIHELRNQQFQDKYYLNPNKCLYCGNIIPYEKRQNKFCNSTCSAYYNNDKYKEKYIRNKNIKFKTITKNNRIKIAIYCLNCGKEIIINHNHGKHKFCNTNCQHEYRFKKKCELIEERKEFPASWQGECNRQIVKKYLIYKNGHKCSICGNTEWMGQPIPLVVDHIDGNPLNNKIDNFRLVCGNCDMQLPTYKSKNRGHGRNYRRNNGKMSDQKFLSGKMWINNGFEQKLIDKNLDIPEGWNKGMIT